MSLNVISPSVKRTGSGFIFGELEAERWVYKSGGYGIEITAPGFSLSVTMKPDGSGLVVEIDGKAVKPEADSPRSHGGTEKTT